MSTSKIKNADMTFCLLLILVNLGSDCRTTIEPVY